MSYKNYKPVFISPQHHERLKIVASHTSQSIKSMLETIMDLYLPTFEEAIGEQYGVKIAAARELSVDGKNNGVEQAAPMTEGFRSELQRRLASFKEKLAAVVGKNVVRRELDPTDENKWLAEEEERMRDSGWK